MERFDFLVIGAGPAGQRAAIQAAKLGKRAGIIEKRAVVGGVAVHTGTIPSKTLREAVLYLSGWSQRGFYGRSYRVKPDLSIDDLMHRLNVTLGHEVEVMQHQLARNGVSVIEGSAAFTGPHGLRVDTGGAVREYEADAILIATGTHPVRPEGIVFDAERVLDSDDILELKSIPRSLTVIGAGVIGVEYASIFSALDVKITLVDGRESMLDFLDKEIVDELQHHLRDHNVVLRMGENVASVERAGEQVIVRLESGKRFKSDVVLFAAGRAGSTDRLALEQAGLSADSRGRLRVNEHYQTEVGHIYAAGDVIGFPSLASTSMEQGRIAARHAFGCSGCTAPSVFPFGIYAVPEISMVGKTERELTQEKIPYEVGVARLRETARGQILGLQEGVLKMIFALEDGRLLGVHVLGEGATELVHIGQAALQLGATLDYFLESVFNYPTLAEAYKIASLDAANRMVF